MPKRKSSIKQVVVSTPQFVDGPAVFSPVPIQGPNDHASLAVPSGTPHAERPDALLEGKEWAFWGTRIVLEIIWLITPLSL